MTGKSVLKMRAAAAVLLACCAGTGSARAQQGQTADILIKGGTIYDGTEGNKPMVGDVAIRGDRIVYVGPKANLAAKRTIDAKGLTVSPGFIDDHTHPDHFLNEKDPQLRQAPAWIMQGASTIVYGVDGIGPTEIKDLFDKTRLMGLGVNLVAFVGDAPIRSRVIGQDARPPTAAELLAEKDLIAKAMCEGAAGFSTGLFYTPQFFGKTEEIVELAKEAAKRGGIYDTHQRDEGDYTVGLIPSTKEALQIGKEAGLPVHFAHIKALGPDVWGKSPEVIKLIDEARANGQIVTADQYPYPSGETYFQAFVIPAWAQDGGYPALIKRFNDPRVMARIETDTNENLRRMGGAHAILFTQRNRPWTGKYLDELAKEWKVTPFEATVRILRQTDKELVIGFMMAPNDIDNFMKQPWVATGSDGADGHPRQYATFPTKYQDYVKKRHVISMGDFIHRSTGLSADIYSLDHRGTLKAGNYADVLVFDPEHFLSKADYVNWDALSSGVVDLVVNGKFAVDGGKMTAVLSGRPLPHTPTPGSCP